MTAHGISFGDFAIPDYIKEYAKEIASSWEGKTFLGAISEMKFVYNQNNQKWYYLGIETDPKIDVYNCQAISGNYMVLDSADVVDNVSRKWLVNANARLHSLELFAENQKKKNLK